MRSSSVTQLFRHTPGGGGGKVIAPLSGMASAPPTRSVTKRIDAVRAIAPMRFTRLCLGIGDGSLRRQ
jgi:hypothetical protein